jgi:iron complex outermembrane receptor protein
MMKNVLMLLGILFAPAIVFAESIDLEKVVVTPYRYDGAQDRATSSMTVINENDIRNSGATTTADVLRSVPGLAIKDLYGNGTSVTVDMAGFGEQAAYNTLVMVDGRRVNGIDFSGVDWKQIPLEAIERVEVLRGGAGAVLYGSNTSGGVINIITKKGLGKPEFLLEAAMGSYSMNAEKVSVQGREKKLSYRLSVGRDSTLGYRENAYSRDQDFSLGSSYALTEILSLRFDTALHQASYGMPGALRDSHINDQGRRFTRYGRDHAITEDWYQVLGASADFKEAGTLDMDVSYRRKDTDSFFLTSHNDITKNTFDSVGMTPRYTLEHSLFDRRNKIIVGMDRYADDFLSNVYSDSTDDKKSWTHVRKSSLGGYLNDDLLLTDQLTLSGGWRYETAKYLFRYHDITGGNPDVDQRVRQACQAFQAGLSYEYEPHSTVFVNAAENYRFPQTDEFSYYQNSPPYTKQLNPDLKPQSGITYQGGVRHALGEKTKVEGSVFRMKLRDELYNDFNAGQNRNYDRTVHDGIAASFETEWVRWLTMSGGYTFTRARFDGGEFNNNDIPLVPRHAANAGLRFLPVKGWAWDIMGKYTGAQVALNDQPNTQGRTNGYFVADMRLSFEKANWTASFGVNNLFGKKYAEYVGDSFGRYYYPSPERNYTLKTTYRF